MGIDPGILFPFGDHVGPDGNLKAGGKGILRYLYPFGDNVDANGNVKPRGGGKLAGGYYGPGGNPSGSGQGQAQQKPGMGPYQGLPVPETPEVSAPTRDVQKANGAKGTQTSPGGGMPVLDAATAAQFLQTKGIGRGAFSSIQLPGTATNPDSGNVPDAIPFNGQATSFTKNTLGAFSATNGQANPALDSSVFTTEFPAGLTSQFSQFGGMSLGNGAPTSAPAPAQGGKGYTEIKPSDPMFAKAFGQDLADKQNKGNTSRLNEALSDTASMRGPETQESLMMRANAAFLNAKTAQEGLRAKEAVLGQFHAGGETYQLNDAGTGLLQGENNKPAAMDRKAASSYRLGTSSAEDYKESYKGKVKEVVAEQPVLTPKQGENPFAQTPAPATSVFKTDIPAGTFAPNSEKTGQLMDTVRQMGGTPPLSSQQISDSFLNKREPLMRDPRKK